MDLLELGQEVCRDFDAATSREWLETNGIGGYASGTISGVNTRRYHGWLVAAVVPPATRRVLLSKIEETLTVDSRKFELSANAYPDSINPRGYELLDKFRLAPFPTWTFQTDAIQIEKSILMPHGANAIVVEYKFRNLNQPNAPIEFELRPLVAFRDFHSLRGNDESTRFEFETSENSIKLSANDDESKLYFNFDNAEVEPENFWYRNFEYADERERGFNFQENLFQPFALKFKLDGEGEQKISLIVSTENNFTAADADDLRENELRRRAAIVENAGFENKFLRRLVAASDQFIVKRRDGQSIIAGYPWFGDWGRDTMIALSGLTLTTNRTDIARQILLEYAAFIDEGMLPNRFPDVGETPEYNTVDATLWYFEAIRQYVEKSGDYATIEREIYPKLVDIITWHLRGTRYHIRVDTDGLLCAGDATTQLTWMDAKNNNVAFTPRAGKAVEIQALWFNALRTMQNLAARFNNGDNAAQYAAMADLCEFSFNQAFWNKDQDCLFDCINGTRDAAIRPNQIFAVSLNYSMLPPEKAGLVVRKVEQELLTPVGLRSLAPNDPKYRGRYTGNGFERDSIYHQGTVWAWLSGAFFTAYAKVFADEPDTKDKLKSWLAPFEQHLSEAGLNQISEIFDGDAPHKPRGCFAQAWSVAEILRAAADIK